MPTFLVKKALFSAFLIFSVSFAHAQDAVPDCRLPGAAEPVTIAAVSDGDTVRLQDGRRVRLLGFGALEVDREHPERSSALALEAKKTLQWLVPKASPVSLLTDKEKYDVHGRTLAQLIRADGRDVAQTLLEQGLAHTYIFPPNDFLWRCYQRYENTARAKSRGLWQLPQFQLQAATTVRAGASGYQILQGQVSGYRKRGDALTVVLDTRIFVHIRGENAARFVGIWSLPAVGQPLAVRGVLNWRQGKGHLDLRHPQALVLNP